MLVLCGGSGKEAGENAGKVGRQQPCFGRRIDRPPDFGGGEGAAGDAALQALDEGVVAEPSGDEVADRAVRISGSPAGFAPAAAFA